MERIVPREKWLYNDRGMMKWMGWLLSDHSAFMEKAKGKETPTTIKPEMDTRSISNNLARAWERKQTIIIQMNAIEGNAFVPEMKGQIIGFNAGQVYLLGEDGSTKLLYVENIRYAALSNDQKWWMNDDTL